MANQTGFQSNTTIQAAFWVYKPDMALDPVGREIMVNVNALQYLESTPDHNKVWLYYAATNVSTSQEPQVLEGLVAQAFMVDMENLFS